MAVPDLQDAIDHLHQKDLDAAVAALERKIDELPAHLTAHVLLARAYEAKHRWQDALTCWENVCFLMPNSPVGQDGKARVLRRLDRGEEAEEAAPDEEDRPASTAEEHQEAEEPRESSPDATEQAPSATDAASELEQLRKQAEKEARTGGARPELADKPAPDSSSDASDDEDQPPSPEERVGGLEDEDDLDRLIDQLESARIEPQPDVEDVPTPDLDHDVDDLVSETLARIHEAQDQYREAAQIYVKLASQEPDRARDFLEKAAEMRKRAEAEATDPENQ